MSTCLFLKYRKGNQQAAPFNQRFVFTKLSSGYKMTDKAQELQQLISLSQIMLEKAQNELWDDVIVLEGKRRELLRLFFLGSSVQQEYADAAAAGIELILSIDRDLMELGVLKRFDIAQALQEMGQGKKAVKAYTA
jgi:Flagellar protein FliT